MTELLASLSYDTTLPRPAPWPTGAAVEAAELERIRLAAELHDGPIQILSAAQLRLAALERQLGAGSDADDPGGEVAEIRSLLGGVADDLRFRLFELAAPDEDLVDLRADLGAFLRDFEQQVQVGCLLTDTRRCEAPWPVERAVFRIVQQAVLNAREHGAANHIWIRLRDEDGLLVVTVRDDGRGFVHAAADTAAGHLGMRIMAWRAQSIGGTLTVDSAPFRGTAITVSVPLAPVT